MWFTDCSCICVCSRYINYLDDVFWSTEFKVHSIDGEGNGWQTVYFTTVKCVLGRGGGKVEEENERRMTEK